MKMTKKLEAEVLELYKAYWDSYAKGTWRKTASFLDDNIRMIGSTESEVYNNKKEVTRFFKNTAKEVAGKIDFRNRHIEVLPATPHILINETLDLYIQSGERWVFYSKIRLSSLLKKSRQGWKFIQQHGSVPDASVEKDETIAFRQVEKENRELREAVKRRTAELEQKNRELEIEAALERVRSRAMAMQKSDELAEAAQVLYREFGTLGIKGIITCGYMFVDESTNTQTAWMVLPDGQLLSDFIVFPLTGDPVLDERYTSWKQKKAIHVAAIEGEANREHHRFLSGRVPSGVAEHIPDRVIFYNANFSEGYLLILTAEFFSAEDEQAIIRFARVFEIAYTRFRDLKKAEEQAMEAKIEAAVEKVRSRSLAMHKSGELQEVVHTVFERLKELDVDFYTAIIILFTEGTKDIVWWLESKANQQYPRVLVPFTPITYFKDLYARRAEGADLLSKCYSFDEKNELFRHLFEKTDFAFVPEQQKQFLLEAEFATMSVGLARHTGIHITSYSKKSFSDRDNQIIIRFAKVFDQAYTRFLDLQKVEAQAREAQIEAALERVRAKAMAMHRSGDLAGAVETVFVELDKLNLGAQRCGIGIINKEKRSADYWATSVSERERSVQLAGDESMDSHPLLQGAFDAWLRQEDYSYVLKGEDLVRYYQAMAASDFPLPESQFILNGDELSEQHYQLACFDAGGLFAFRDTPFPEEAKLVMKRFAGVFNLTYKRFQDLQKAEAQAREAQIEASLERVRAKVMAMSKSSDLDETSLVFGEQLRKLGINWQFSYFWLVEEARNENTFWITWPDSRTSITVYTLAEAEKYFNECLVSWRNGVKIHESFIPPGEVQEWLDTFQRITDDAGGVAKEIMVPQNFAGGVYYYDAMMKYGSFGICISLPATEEEKNIQCRFAIEFERAYTRFLDLKTAEAHAEQARLDLIQIQREKKRAEEALDELQATQKQLIQSEKMASLGELTAGIAHEIQNPLNFVNNFSELSHELLDEMQEELSRGNLNEGLAIAGDVKQNLEKITHHGKRADAIVKGMLQHSRSSNGQKELTPINALADEYLRLAYHGLRAKDKSFNAKFETDFDNRIGEVNLAQQEIGRVLLNLINNAFYAVTERKKQADDGYEPVVSVSTRKMENTIEIAVKDNGTGIPPRVLEKIFQPFFTTKPAGQGTGLGLSLAYDIITKGHDGELIVETREGEGSTFIIKLKTE